MTGADWQTLACGLVFVVLFCMWVLHVGRTLPSPKVPRDHRSGGRWVFGVGIRPFWFFR